MKGKGKPLPEKDVSIRADRTGPARLTAPELKALESVTDENLRRTLGEMLLRSRGTQRNFEAISGWFPLRPGDVSQAVLADRAVFHYTYREGPEYDGSEPGTIRFDTDPPELNDATEMAIAYRDLDGKDLGHILEYFASTIVDPLSSSTHRGIILVHSEGGTAFNAFEVTFEPGTEYPGTYSGKGFEIKAITAEPIGKSLQDGERVVVTAIGALGEAGEKGEDGRDAGLHYTWSTNTENSDPGAGKAKRNAGSTILRLSETDADGSSVAAFLATWDDSTTLTNRGTIIIRQVGAPKRFRVYKITGALEDAGTYDNIAVALVGEGEALQNEAEVAIEWIRTGDQGEKGEKGETGGKGEKGEAGTAGAEGRSAGLKYTYSTNTESSDPGLGKLKFNKATLSEATILRISETDGDGNAIAPYIATWDDSTSTTKGFFVLRKVGSPTVFAAFSTSGVLNDNGTWDSFTVAHVVSNGLANSDVVTVEFYRTGDKGDTGEKGEKGATGEKGGTGEKGATGERGVGAGLIWEWEGTKISGEVAEQKARLLESGGKKYLEVSRNALGVILAAGYIEEWKRLPVGSLFLVQQSQSRWAVYKTLAKATIVEEEGAKEHLKVEVEQVASNVAPEAGKEVSVTNEPIPPGTDFGLVTALPTGAIKGDRCYYIVDEEKGIVWELVYSGSGTKWLKVGGAPLYAEVAGSCTATAEAFGDPATGGSGPEIALPLKGDYGVTIGARIWQTVAARASEMSYAIGGTAASASDQIDLFTASVSGGVGDTPNTVRKRLKTGLTAVTLKAKYRRTGGSGTATFEHRWIEADPVFVE